MTWDGALSEAPGDDPWRSLDLAPSVRRLAERAAAAAGLGIEEWLERAIRDACPNAAAETPAPQPPAAPTAADPWLAELLAVTRRLPPLPAPLAEPELDPFPTVLDPSAPLEDASPAAEAENADDQEESEEAEPAAPPPAPSDAKPMSDLVAKLWSEPEEELPAAPRRAEHALQELEQQRLEWRGLLRLGPEEPDEKSAAEREPAAAAFQPPRPNVIPPPPTYPAAAASDVEPAFTDVTEEDVAAAEPIPLPWRPVSTGEPAAEKEPAPARSRRPWRLLLAVLILLSSLAAGVLTARYLLPNVLATGGAHQAKITLVPLLQPPPSRSETAAAVKSEPVAEEPPPLPPIPSAAALAPSSAAAPPPAAEPQPSDADPRRVAAWLAERAKGGDAKASYSLGILYALGRGVPKDYPRAAQLFRAAAESGMPEAEYNVAVMYGDGMGVQRDVSQAIYWYRKAAAQGNANAAFNLGTAYADGTGVARDMATAARWFRRAAGQGVVNAEYNLGLLYERGEGVRASRIEAYAWYVAAALQGDEGAAHRRDRLAAALSPAQLTAAKTRAANLQYALEGPQRSASAAR